MAGVQSAAPGSDAQSHHPHLDRQKIGKRLIIAAWVVEILAAFIGVLIAALVIVSTQQSIGDVGGERLGISAGLMNAFLGGLPFIVVAAVELTKIPLATACYHARSRVWKIVLSAGLAFLMVITFETILNGFERNFTQRTYIIKILKKKLIAAEEDIAKKSRDVETLTATTPSINFANYEREIAQINKNRVSELAELDKQIQRSRITASGQDAEALQQQKQQIDEDIARAEQDYVEERKRVSGDFAEQKQQTPNVAAEKRAAIEDEIAALEQELGRIDQAQQKELSGVKSGGGDKSALNRELTRIEEDFAERISNAKAAAQSGRARLAARIAAAQSELAALDKEQADTIEREFKTSFFTSKESIAQEVAAKFEPRMVSARDRLKTLENSLSGMAVADVVRDLESKKDRAIDDAKTAQDSQGSSGSAERAAIRKKFAAEKRPKERRLAKLRGGLQLSSTQSINADLVAQRDARLKAIKQDYEKRRSGLAKRRDELIQALAKALGAAESASRPVLQRLQTRRDAVIERYADARKISQQRYAFQQKELETRAARITGLEARIRELGEQRLKHRDDIARYAEDSQIYRVAGLWTGKDSPADVTNEELRVVSLVWFGSLALITAWTGTLLAFAGLVVQDGQRRRERAPVRAWHAVARAFRRLFVTRRRLALKPRERIVEKEVVKQVEVVKEVPVDSVVMNVFSPTETQFSARTSTPASRRPAAAARRQTAAPPPPPPPRGWDAVARSIGTAWDRVVVALARFGGRPIFRHHAGAWSLLAAMLVVGAMSAYIGFAWFGQSSRDPTTVATAAATDGQAVIVAPLAEATPPEQGPPKQTSEAEKASEAEATREDETARREAEAKARRDAAAEVKARRQAAAEAKVQREAEESARKAVQTARAVAEKVARRTAEAVARQAARAKAQRKAAEDSRKAAAADARRQAEARRRVDVRRQAARDRQAAADRQSDDAARQAAAQQKIVAEARRVAEERRRAEANIRRAAAARTRVPAKKPADQTIEREAAKKIAGKKPTKQQAAQQAATMEILLRAEKEAARQAAVEEAFRRAAAAEAQRQADAQRQAAEETARRLAAEAEARRQAAQAREAADAAAAEAAPESGAESGAESDAESDAAAQAADSADAAEPPQQQAAAPETPAQAPEPQESQAPPPALTAIDDFKAGIAAVRRKDFDEAIARLSPAIASGKLARAQLAAAYRRRGESYAGKKQFQLAVADYTETIRLLPGDPSAYNSRGHAYNWLGRGDKALADTARAIALKPDYAYAYSNRCWAYQKLRQRAKAIADCRRALELNPKLDFARRSLERMGVKAE